MVWVSFQGMYIYITVWWCKCLFKASFYIEKVFLCESECLSVSVSLSQSQDRETLTERHWITRTESKTLSQSQPLSQSHNNYKTESRFWSTANSNLKKISIWICTARYLGIQIESKIESQDRITKTVTITKTITANPTWGGWHFRMLFQSSKLKARTSLFTETWQKRRSSLELWAFENVTPSGIGCTRQNRTTQ